jgi:transcriptional regulator with XRE-family HTH domain
MAHPLKEARKSASLSQQALADLTCVDRVTIARIESGRYRASLETIENIIKALRANKIELSADAFLPASQEVDGTMARAS